MITLVVNDSEQITLMEWELIQKKIQYEVCPCNTFGFNPPYLIVDGVPLDNIRSLLWIEGKMINE